MAHLQKAPRTLLGTVLIGNEVSAPTSLQQTSWPLGESCGGSGGEREDWKDRRGSHSEGLAGRCVGFILKSVFHL